MARAEPAVRIDDLRALIDAALHAADTLGLEMVAAHLSMARDALVTGEADE